MVFALVFVALGVAALTFVAAFSSVVLNLVGTLFDVHLFFAANALAFLTVALAVSVACVVFLAVGILCHALVALFFFCLFLRTGL